jgi:hypothetical protein
MNNEPRRGDGGSGIAIAPTGLRNVRAPYRGFASTLTPGYALPAHSGAGKRHLKTTGLSDSLGSQ